MAAARPDREPRSAAKGALARVRSAGIRLLAAWRVLDAHQRLAAGCAVGLFVTMLLPWYTKTEFVVSGTVPKVGSVSLSAFAAFSFVEAAVLLVSAGVLAILFARAEGRAFHLPGGDGTIIMVAGAWAAILIFYRLLDKTGTQSAQHITASVGVTWGIFLALLVAIGLAIAGARVRAEHRPEPPLGGPSRAPVGAGERHRRATTPEPPTAATAADGSPAGAGERARPGTPVPDDGVARLGPAGEERGAPPSRPRYPPPPAGGQRRGRIVTREDAAQLSFEDTSATEALGEDLPPRRRGDDPPPRRRRR